VTQPSPNLWFSHCFVEPFLQVWVLQANRTSSTLSHCLPGSFPSWITSDAASHWIQAQQFSNLMEQSTRKFIPWHLMTQVLLFVVKDTSANALL